MVDVERQRATLGHPDLEWLVQRIRRRIEQGRSLDGVIVLQTAARPQWRAVQLLLGDAAPSGETLRVPLKRLAGLLQESGMSPSLRAAVEALTGPVTDRATRLLRRAEDRRLCDVFAQRQPLLRLWLESPRGRRFVRRARPEVWDQLDALIALLPLPGRTLAEVAALVTGDSHALDRGRPLGILGARWAALRAGFDVTQESIDRRLAWATVGILCDELSAPVLT